MKNKSIKKENILNKFAALALLLAFAAGCGGRGGNIAIVEEDGSQVIDVSGDEGMPSLQAMLTAEPEDDAFGSARSASAVVSVSGDASSTYPGRNLSDAFDGDSSTFWTGGLGETEWILSYQFPTATFLSQVSVMFHSNNFVPGSTVLELSSDGVNWTNEGSASAPNLNPTFTFSETSALYLRITMTGAPYRGAPSIREVDWLQPASNSGVYAYPNLNVARYFPSLMFDGNPNTYWVGTPNAGTWDIYYCFDAPRYIELVTLKYFRLAYIPTATTLYLSDDGTNWTTAGDFSPGLNEYAYVGRSVSCVKITLSGTPPKTMPIISELRFDLPPGPSSPDTINKYFTPEMTIDSKVTTWWTGAENKNEWTFYYSLENVELIDKVTIYWKSGRTIPAQTSLYRSMDGENWTFQSNFNYNSYTARYPSEEAKYLKLVMTGAPPFGKPAMKEIQVASTFLSPIINISVGISYSCALYRNGSIKCWGYNNMGQLGDQTTTNSDTPVSVIGINNAISVAAGYSKTCAALQTGEMKCWGAMPLGDDYMHPADSMVPVSLWRVTNASSASLNSQHFCLVDGGVTKCWGNNDFLQLGNGLSSTSMVPVNAWRSANVIAVATGAWHTCELVSDGGVKCWGVGEYGQLGDGQTCANYGNPTYVVTDAVSIASGYAHTCAVINTGGIKCWGWNASGQLGNRSFTNALRPVSVSEISNAVSIVAGSVHTCALLLDGSVKCFGENTAGQLGNGTTTISIVPVSVVGLTNVQSLSAKSNTTCALLDTGEVKCWGGTYNTSIPTTVEGL